MSLFDSASLVVTPNGYKAGKLYSIKPTSGAGDLDVVRATSATRVNASGLIEIPRTNLLLRSEEFNDAYWGLSNATILLNATNAPNGTLTADKIYPNSTGTIRGFNRNTLITLNSHAGSIFAKWDGGSIEILTLTRGSLADISFNVKTGQIVGTIPTGMTASITSFSNGWYRCSWAYNSANTLTFYQLVLSSSANSFSVTANGTDGIFIWGAQLEIGNVATEYIPTTSVIRTRFAGITQDGGSANNIPRLDYTNASCPSILVEPQRTNLLLRSEEFDNAYWVKNSVSVTANNTSSPSGTMTADLVANTSAGGYINNTSFVGSTGSVYSFSFYIKNNTSTSTLILVREGSSALSATINWSGANISSITNTIGSISSTALTNGWFRIMGTYTALENNQQIRIYPQSVSGTNSVFLWGAQLEVGSNATSYIPTQASTVTRNADVISKTGVSSLIGQTEGTLYAEVRVSRLLGVASRYIFHLSDGTSNNRIYIAFSGASSNILRARIFNGGVLQANIESSTITTLGTFKLALAYNNNDIVFYINGVQIGTDTSATIPTCSRVDVGHNQAGASQFNDSINSALIFPTRLSNAELAQLTTL